MFTGQENNNIIIDLTQVALTTGWSVSEDGSVATHDSCNPGNLYLLNYPLIIGQTYRYTYQVNYVTSGYVATNLGGHISIAGLVDETVIATSTQLYFFSNGSVQIQDFNIELDEEILPADAQNTIAFNEKINKWTSFYTIAPDSGMSMFTKTFVFKDGDAYVQEANTPFRCNFFGNQYPATIWFSTNQQPTLAKTFQSLNYQANQLLVTPSLGINTSTGQQSELINIDFLQATYHDGINPDILVYEAEGLYKASFMREFPDLVNGNILKGNYMVIGLETTASSGILTLFTTEVEYNHSMQNIR